MKSFLGKKFMGTIRSTMVIDNKGKLIKIWLNVRVKGHAQEVLEFIKSIKIKRPDLSGLSYYRNVKGR